MWKISLSLTYMFTHYEKRVENDCVSVCGFPPRVSVTEESRIPRENKSPRVNALGNMHPMPSKEATVSLNWIM